MTSNPPSYQDGLRMMRIVCELQRSTNGEMRVNQLAERLGVSRRTVVRYTSAMHADNLPDADMPSVVRTTHDGEVWVRLDRREKPPETHQYQYLLAQVGLQVLSSGGASLYSETVGQHIASMRTKLGRRRNEIVGRVANAFLYRPFGAKRYDRASDKLGDLLLAVLGCHPIDIDYRDRRRNALSRSLEPFTLVLYRDGLYVLGLLRDDEGNERWRLFALDRVESLDVRKKETFKVPDGFDPATLFENTLGLWPANQDPVDLHLAFSPHVVIDVKERTWPGGSWEGEREDGWSVMRMRVTITPEVIAWIRSWGGDVEVIGSAQVRRAVDGMQRRARPAEGEGVG